MIFVPKKKKKLRKIYKMFLIILMKVQRKKKLMKKFQSLLLNGVQNIQTLINILIKKLFRIIYLH